jgi:hypothetical protein
MKTLTDEQKQEIVRLYKLKIMNKNIAQILGLNKHSAHHLQQVERLLYDLLEDEKYQISIAHIEGAMKMHHEEYISCEQYYNENYGKK